MTGWHDKQFAAHEKIEQVKSVQGARMLDGEAYDVDELIEAEAELALLYSAEGEDLRRRNAQAAATEALRRAEAEERLITRYNERLDALDAAEVACNALADAFREIFKSNADIALMLKRLGRPVPIGLGDWSAKMRLAIRVSSVLGPACGKHFGYINFQSTGGHILPDGQNPADSWRAADIKMNPIVLKAKKRTTP